MSPLDASLSSSHPDVARAPLDVTPDLVVYDHARLYDVAFSDRDFTHEASTMTRWATALMGRAPSRALELCAGPADHAIALAARGVRAVALDLSTTMCAYASEKARANGAAIDVLAADMRDFTVAAPVDLAFTMLNSISHVHTLEDLVGHFRAIRAALVDGGVYVLEVQHPKDFVGRGRRASGVSRPWTVAQADAVVETTWGHEDDPYDPVRQVFSAHVTLRARFGDHEHHEREVVRMRDWTLDELRAAAMLAGGISLVATHGDFDDATPLDGSDASWRMILVFQRGA